MVDLQAYYQAIREHKDELAKQFPDGFLHVTSIRNFMKNITGGTVTEVNLATGARHIFEGTARPSTKEEIAAHKQRGESFTARMNAEDQKRSGQRFVNFIQGPQK